MGNCKTCKTDLGEATHGICDACYNKIFTCDKCGKVFNCPVEICQKCTKEEENEIQN